MNLTALAETFSCSHTASLEAFHAQALGAIGSIERLAALHIHVTRSLLEDGAVSAREVFFGETQEGVFEHSYQNVKPRLERAAAYARGLLEISAAAQQELSGVTQRWFATQSQIFRRTIEDASQAGPLGPDAVLAAISSAVADSKALFERVSQAGAESMAGANALSTEALDAKAKTGSKVAPTRKTKSASEDEA